MTHVTRDDFGRIVVWLDDCTCEDCQLRETEGPRDDSGELRYSQPPSLTPDGSPAYHPTYGFRMTSGCAGCGGTGRSTRDAAFATFEENVLHTRLTLKQRFVMERRLGFIDERKYSQREVAAAMGITRQAVAKHETAAKERLEATVRKGLPPRGCISTRSEGKSRAGEENGQASRRRGSSPSVYHPPQHTSGSTSWDIYFAGSKDAHTHKGE